MPSGGRQRARGSETAEVLARRAAAEDRGPGDPRSRPAAPRWRGPPPAAAGAPRPGCAPAATPRRRPRARSTAAWAMIGPVSTPLSTKCTVHPVDLHARLERLALRAHARERGQEGRVDVDDAAGEGAQHLVAQHAHEAGQHDQIGLLRAQAGHQRAVEAGARRVIAVIDDERRQARRRAPAPARRSRERWSRRRRCAQGPARRGARDR